MKQKKKLKKYMSNKGIYISNSEKKNKREFGK